MQLFDVVLSEDQIKGLASLPVGMGDMSPETSGELMLWPNPCSGYLNIFTGNWPGIDLQVTLYDITGRIVLRKYFTSGSIFGLNLPDSLSGIYILKITGSGKTMTKKLIIN